MLITVRATRRAVVIHRACDRSAATILTLQTASVAAFTTIAVLTASTGVRLKAAVLSGGAIIIAATLMAGVVIATILVHRTPRYAAAVHASRAPIVVGTITIGVASGTGPATTRNRDVLADAVVAHVTAIVRAVVAVVATRTRASARPAPIPGLTALPPATWARHAHTATVDAGFCAVAEQSVVTIAVRRA